MYMNYNIVNVILQVIGLVISYIACHYTVRTYKKSHAILDEMEDKRKYDWNRKELEILFSTLSIDSINNFLGDPDHISNDLWMGLRAVNLDEFQYEGIEKTIIVDFINGLDNFKYLRYKQTPSKHWKFEPLSERESFDADKEMQEEKKLHEKAKALSPLYEDVKKVLMKYHIDIREINAKARYFYDKKMEEELNLMSE